MLVGSSLHLGGGEFRLFNLKFYTQKGPIVIFLQSGIELMNAALFLKLQ
ncbi:hypothetical protein CLV31_104212 [Algoriphagus aquaeductus]|uniref:Uncharacterized protein n=1 Tax=Algoriphagus aquaeductus TaxID=475299 RepID=A0A326RTM0_9BACT|nr:hypothetical protein CLV31_104212 [Algoriphagus aquaeductus]